MLSTVMLAHRFATIVDVESFRDAWRSRCPTLCDSDIGLCSKYKYLRKNKEIPCNPDLKAEILHTINTINMNETINSAIHRLKHIDNYHSATTYPTDQSEIKIDIEEKNEQINIQGDDFCWPDSAFYSHTFAVHILIDENSEANVFMQLKCGDISYQTPPFIYT